MFEVSVAGQSMEPAISNGDTLEFEEIIDSKDLIVNDIILCKHPFVKNLKIIKRISKITDDGFYITGDNKFSYESSDSRSFGPVHPSKVIGKLNNDKI